MFVQEVFTPLNMNIIIVLNNKVDSCLSGRRAREIMFSSIALFNQKH